MQSMPITEAKVANALGGKTARACDSCLHKRARWYCAADDAFLCQACDTSVHSANQLASRHERARLQTSSFKSAESRGDENSTPVWHQGFTRKARTPRNNKLVQHPKEEEKTVNSLHLVPEIGSEEVSSDVNEDQEHLLCRVPVFEPFAAELCTETSDQVENIQTDHGGAEFIDGTELNVLPTDNEGRGCDLDIPEIIASDAELAEFAADVESLLGTAFDEDSCGVEGLGIIERKMDDDLGVPFGDKRVKVEVEDEDEEVKAVIACHFDPALDSARESLNWDFDFSSIAMSGEEEELKFTIERPMTDCENKAEEKRSIFLKLNYEAVITEWATQGSPWINGTKPDFNPDDCWPDFMGTGSGTLQHPYGAAGGRSGGSRDEDREARVSRYREKRRTRFFSKKIRYEVRKLNAEKRPRMKGRFVKRTSFAGSSFPYLMNK